MKTSLIGTQGCTSSLAATEPGGFKPGVTQAEVAAGGSQKVGYKLLKRLLIATVTATMFSTSAHAALCEGPIAAVAVHDDGRLYVRQGASSAFNPLWRLCNIENDTGYQVKVATCKSWMAILMAAHKTGSTVALYTHSTPCNLADWGSADAYYIEDRG